MGVTSSAMSNQSTSTALVKPPRGEATATQFASPGARTVARVRSDCGMLEAKDQQSLNASKKEIPGKVCLPRHRAFPGGQGSEGHIYTRWWRRGVSEQTPYSIAPQSAAKPIHLMESPVRASTLMTEAPRSARRAPQLGAAIQLATSTTTTPDSGRPSDVAMSLRVLYLYP